MKRKLLLILLAVVIAACSSTRRSRKEAEVNPAETEVKNASYLTQKDGLPSNTITAIHETKYFVWIGTDKGLARYDKLTGEIETFNRKNSALPSNNVVSIVSDSIERVWIGCYGGGVVRIFRDAPWKIYDTTNELPSNLVTVLYVESEETGIKGENLWIGTRTGLVRYSAGKWFVYQTGPFSSILSPSDIINDSIRDVKSSKNYVWVGTEKGLGRFNGVSWRKYFNQGAYDLSKFTKIEDDKRWPFRTDEVSFIEYDESRNRIWAAGTDGEVAFMNTRTEIWDKISFPKSSYISLMRLHGNKLFVGRARARRLDRLADLRVYDITSQKWKVYTKSNGLPANRVSVIEIIEDKVWVGTASGILIAEKTFFDLKGEIVEAGDETKEQYYLTEEEIEKLSE